MEINIPEFYFEGKQDVYTMTSYGRPSARRNRIIRNLVVLDEPVKANLAARYHGGSDLSTVVAYAEAKIDGENQPIALVVISRIVTHWSTVVKSHVFNCGVCDYQTPKEVSSQMNRQERDDLDEMIRDITCSGHEWGRFSRRVPGDTCYYCGMSQAAYIS